MQEPVLSKISFKSPTLHHTKESAPHDSYKKVMKSELLIFGEGVLFVISVTFVSVTFISVTCISVTLISVTFIIVTFIRCDIF